MPGLEYGSGTFPIHALTKYYTDYASAKPLDDVGTIYVLNNGTYISIEIPGIKSSNDIVDYEKGIYEKINNSNPMKTNGTSFGFIDNDNFLTIYSLDE